MRSDETLMKQVASGEFEAFEELGRRHQRTAVGFVYSLADDSSRAEERMAELRRKKQRLFVQYMTDKKQYLDRTQEKKFFGILRKDRDCHKHARFLENRGHSSHKRMDDH